MNLPRLCVLLASLRTYQLWSQATHWNVSGPNYYSDHLLYQRLYTEVEPQVDALAEKIMSYQGRIDFLDHLQLISKMTTHYLGTSSYTAEENLKIVSVIRNQVTKILGDSDLPNGLQDYLQGLDNLLESHVYLLQQRIGC